MASKFEGAIGIVLENEGEAFTDIPGDPGGATKWGITLRAAEAHRLARTVEQLKLVPRAEAVEFYRNFYWLPAFELFATQPMATKVFDTGVNLGPAKAVKLLQQAINVAQPTENWITVDGHLGPETMARANAMDADVLLDNYRRQQSLHYQHWVSENTTERMKFLKGLLNRAESC